MQPAERLAAHGLSHTLYLGLGYVENKWGIRYDDDYGEETARRDRSGHRLRLARLFPA